MTTSGGITLKNIRALTKIASDAGLEIHENDYGWTIGAVNKRLGDGIYISRVYIPKRDGYSGLKVIAKDVLRDWIKDNPV